MSGTLGDVIVIGMAFALIAVGAVNGVVYRKPGCWANDHEVE